MPRTESDVARDPTVEFTPEALADIERITLEDPKAAEAFREFFANLRQAMQSVEDGRYATFEDAMEAITGQRPERVGET